VRQRTWALLSVLVAVLLAIVAGPALAADPVLIDDFEVGNGWTVTRAPATLTNGRLNEDPAVGSTACPAHVVAPRARRQKCSDVSPASGP